MGQSQSQIRPAFCVMRSPLLSFDDLAAWSDGLQAAAVLDAPERLDSALTADRVRLRAGLAALIARPEVRDALYLASPDLDSSLEEWRADPAGDRGRRVERALVRYLTRMATRATPFGLFAGCAVGTISTRTRLMLPSMLDYRRHTRPDMHFLCALVTALECDPAVRATLRFRPNSSLYHLGDRWHWIALTPDDEAHSHRLHRLDARPSLDAVLARAAEGATLDDLRADTDLDLDALVARQLLVSELQPASTGAEPIHAMIELLERIAPTAPLAATAAGALREVRDALAQLDAAGLGVAPARYREIAANLEALPGPVDRSKLLQSELIKTPRDAPGDHGPTLGGDVLAEVERGVEILRRLARPARDSLTRFREAFVGRYEGRGAAGVPLVEVLGAEAGLSFGPSSGHDGSTALLDGLAVSSGPDEPSVRWGDRHTFLLERLSQALAAGARELVLGDHDLDRLANPDPLPLPDAFSVTAVVVAGSAAALERGEFRVALHGAAGPSGARMLGRFCHGDATLRKRVQEYLRAEQALRPDAIFAEIAHLPEPRAGNILHRPVFREHEVAYLGVSGAPRARQIPLTDLLVSVVGGRVVLRSARLGREVIPRLTSAQNYHHPRTAPLYRFLAALQDQGVATGLGWDWGPLANAPFLPRISSGRLVLARARWRMAADETDAIGRARGSDLFRAVHSWRVRRGVPRHVRLADYDNELLVDFDNILSVESFAHLVKGRDHALLIEAVPGPDELCAVGPEGRYFHELSIPFLRLASQESPVAAPDRVHPTPAARANGAAHPVGQAEPAAILPHGDPRPARRTFPPGSEWLYAKLYAAPSMSNRLLREVVRPVTTQALASGAVNGWFFVRYADPDEHLRLRFHGDPAHLSSEVVPALRNAVEPLLADGRLLRLQLDTYEREVERYGGAVGIALSEQIFEEDSRAVLEVVEAFDDEALAEVGWRLALLGMHRLLDDLGLDAAEQCAVLRGLRESFAREHRADQKLLRQLGERYRAERASLEILLDAARAAEGPLAAAVAVVQRRSDRLAPVISELGRAAADGQLAIPRADLASSYLHMHANRMLRSDQRRHEMVLYDFLYRLHDARLARARPAARP